LLIVVLFITSVSVKDEFDITAKPTYIRDGDTFEVSDNVIRLADVSCPETYEVGGYDSTQALRYLIWDRTVYINIDDVYQTGPYGRLICLVYVSWNSTHYLNVNLALVLMGRATITNYDNEWNPRTWTLYVSK